MKLKTILLSSLLCSCSLLPKKSIRQQTELDYVNLIDNPFKENTDRYHAWSDGYEAFEKGCTLSDNPFSKKWEYLAWNEGFLKARQIFEEDLFDARKN